MADENIPQQSQLMQEPRSKTAGGAGIPYSAPETEPAAFEPVNLSDGLAVTLERLAGLLFAEEEDGFPLPTRHAYLTAFHLLNEAYRYLPVSFPRATVSVEENGGVFIYWIKPSGTVQLTVPFEQGKLLYIRTMQDKLPSQVYENPDSKELAGCLLMFNRLS